MIRLFLIFLILLIAGCTTTPLCAMKVNGMCRDVSASERNGAGSRGHTEEIKETR